MVIMHISLKGGKHCRVCSNLGSDEGKQERGDELREGLSKNYKKNLNKKQQT